MLLGARCDWIEELSILLMQRSVALGTRAMETTRIEGPRMGAIESWCNISRRLMCSRLDTRLHGARHGNLLSAFEIKDSLGLQRTMCLVGSSILSCLI